MAIARRAVRPGASAPLKSDDPTVEELSRQLNDLKRSLPLFVTQGLSVDFVASGGGPLTLRHGLGRVPVGWIITDRSSPATFLRLSTGTDSVSLSLFTSAACTGKIWVF